VRSHSQSAPEFQCAVRGCTERREHALWKCNKFAELNCKDKWSIAKKAKCCYKCLNNGHLKTECKFKHCCRICQSNDHHYLLCAVEKIGDNHESNQNANTYNTVRASIHSAMVRKHRKILPVILVLVSSRQTGKYVKVNCLLDSGSDTTLATMNLAEMLNIPAKSRRHVEFKLSTTNAHTNENGYKIDIYVKSINGSQSFPLKNVICLRDGR